jgi:hypothetical protein
MSYHPYENCCYIIFFFDLDCSDIWDNLYIEFIKNHKPELKKFRYYVK